MGICKFAYLNDSFITAEEAMISPFDRGFLFAHAAYEVTAVYGGQLIDTAGHIARLQRTLAGISIPMVWSGPELIALHETLIAKNSMTEGLVYLQVSAGAYGFRDFAGPADIRPALFMYADERNLIGERAQTGILRHHAGGHALDPPRHENNAAALAGPSLPRGARAGR